jgi:hypothetical protein
VPVAFQVALIFSCLPGFGKSSLFLQYPGSDKVKINRMAFEIFGCSTCL